jgi:N-acetylglucosaminyldiphosphoundecaprenol N-acetyl-beta-D-mannosaminyltransferase
MGAPKQELWLTRNREELNCRVALGVGGSFDVLSGRVDRAPLWMQKKGLEWLYRYIREPSRLKRSILLPRFVRLVLKEKFGTSKGETTQ